MPISPSFCDEHVHVVGPGAGQGDLAARHAQRGEERGRLDPVGHDRVLDRRQLLDAFDGDGRAAGPEHLARPCG